MSEISVKLHENLKKVQQVIAESATKSGRRPEEIKLVGVSKYVDSTVTQALFDAGCHVLGESRPQSLWKKSKEVQGDGLEWHLIGHLQSNKVRRTLPLTSLLHSLDRMSILEAVNSEAGSQGIQVNGLIEINISGDEAKHGFTPEKVSSLLQELPQFNHINIVGLMSMASLDGGREQARRDFAALRELRDRLVGQCPESVSLVELSMGMSRDYDIAIEEGATLVRVGSTLFEGLDI